MTSFAFLMIFCIFSLSPAAAVQEEVMEAQSMENSVKNEFLNAEFQIATDRAQIRPQVLAKLTQLGLLIANPGEKYNKTDALDPKYPTQILIFAGQAGDLTFVHYMQGGIVLQSLLYLAKFDGNKIVFEKTYPVPVAKDIQELKEYF